MLPVLPYTRPKTKDGFFRKHEYIYDEHYNCYLCPQGQILKYATTTKEGYRQYKSNPLICAKCPSLSQCTESKHHQNSFNAISGSRMWRKLNIYAIPMTSNKFMQSAKKRLSVSLPMQRKAWYAMDNLKRSEKLSMQAMLTFAAMNLKKLATWTWQAA